MSHVISFDDGETIDLHTDEGAYRHVGRFLRKHGADSLTFSSLGRLSPFKKHGLEHDTNTESCWCEPEVRIMDNGNKVIIHQG
jgi:hypothetical protein